MIIFIYNKLILIIVIISEVYIMSDVCEEDIMEAIDAFERLVKLLNDAETLLRE